jgi:hypothetical protein
MNENLPDPMVPADADLRDFAFMPLDVARLRDSDLAALEEPEACWSAVLLWCASWHQIPAGSLPDDDRVLSNFAGYGRVVKEWQRVKTGAMRGWVLCADGRWYHPVVAEKATESWLSKLRHAYGKLCERIRKENGNRKTAGIDPLPFPTFEAWNSGGRPAEIEILPAEIEILPAEDIRRSVGKSTSSVGKSNSSAGIPAENALKGQGQGQGQGQGYSSEEGIRSPSETAADASASGAVGEEGDDPEDVAWCKSADAVALLTLSGKYNPHHARATLREWVRLHGPTVTRQAIVSAQTVAATDPLTYAAKRLANLRAQGSAGVIRTTAPVEDRPWERLGMTREQWEAV